MPALAPCCLPEANSCDEQQSFQCAEWPGDWYGTMGNVTQQSWLGSNCNALQVFFCQYGTYYSSQLYDCGMECPVDPVLGCMDPDALNHNPDATEDDGSCEYDQAGVGTTGFTVNSGQVVVMNAGGTTDPETSAICEAAYTDSNDPNVWAFDHFSETNGGDCLQFTTIILLF